MSGWQKEELYSHRTRKSTNLWKYIPEKLTEAVSDVNTDDDGYWVYLEDGWSAYDHGSDCTIIHEYNIKDLRQAVRTIENYIEK